MPQSTEFHQNLEQIRQEASAKTTEYEQFRTYIIQFPAEWLDQHANAGYQKVQEQIQCTQCGNCCRSFLINVEEAEIAGAAQQHGINAAEFSERYLEAGQSGRTIINRIPCHFLTGDQCSIYESRFSGCREFPHLGEGKFRERFFFYQMYAPVCPIIFHVLEFMQQKTGFVPQAQTPPVN